MEPDYYKVLGVSADSEDIVIQAAYRALMRRYHPDKNPSDTARQRTVEINAAYAVLGDSSKRAAYDAKRKKRDQSAKTSGNTRNSSPPPPPPRGEKTTPPRPHNHANDAKTSGPSGVKLFFGIIGVLTIITIGIAAGNTNSTLGNNTMNVDENLTTTDMSADENLTTTDMNATDMNAVANNIQPAPDLSKQSQIAVNYSTIEDAANRFAKILTTKGMLGARTYSESCHKAVQTKPSWDAADSCAAFDYAAAYIDDGVSTQNGWPKDGYFEFKSGNQPDDYASVGAPPFVTTERLSKIRSAAQGAVLGAYRYELARRSAARADQPSQQTNPSQPAAGNSSE